MPLWQKEPGWAAGGAVLLVFLLLHPVSLATLGAGIFLGYRWRLWLEHSERSVQK